MELIYKNRKGEVFNIIFDDDMAVVLLKYNWRVFKRKHTCYAMSQFKEGNKTIHLNMHRLVMDVSDLNISVDHKNMNGLDNRKDNLRVCNSSENGRNVKDRGNSKFIGVHYEKQDKRFVAYITINRKRKKIGNFKCEYCAAMERDIEAKKLHGEFANLNFK